MPEMEIAFGRPLLYPKQFAAIYDPHRYSLIEASTKAGKTAGCISWIVEEALKINDGKIRNYWWVAPVSNQADIAFRRMMAAISPNLRVAHRQLKTITLFNGAVIWFKSGDKPDSLYGEDVYAAVIDEASRMKEEAWSAVRSTLTYTRGAVRIIGNVRGRKNWFYQMARKAEQMQDREVEPREMGYHKITAYDAIAAGVLEASEIEDSKQTMGEIIWRELYLAEASDDGGNPFGMSHIEACLIPELSKGEPRYWGWDFAKKQDFTVGIALDERGHVCRFERWQHIPWGETMNRVAMLTGKKPALGDSTGVGDPIVEGIQRILGGVSETCNFQGYQFTAQSKQRLMEGLALAIQTRAVRFPDGVIRKECDEFTFEITRTGVRYTAPEGYYDDSVCALALADAARTLAPAPVVISADFLNRMRQMPPSRRPYR